MKKINIKLFAALLIIMGACSQEVIELETPEIIIPETTPPYKGSADFTKFVAVGDSYTAGFQAGALFNEGQQNSLPVILSKQFSLAQGTALSFNQPDINSINGFNSSSSNVGGGIVRGRLILFDPDGTGIRTAAPAAAGTPANTVTCPSVVSTPAVPAPYNDAQSPVAPSFMFAGDKSKLNNFGVPGAKLLEAAAVPNYGTLNPFYGRFASNPSGKTLVADAAEKQGSFFLFYFGNFDVLGFATSGGVGAVNGTASIDMTPEANFNALFSSSLNAMLATPNSKGVVGNIPDISTLPFFNTITWNNVALIQSQVDALNSTSMSSPGLSTSYNGFLDQLKAAGALTQSEVDKRKLKYAVGSGNAILIEDETLTDLSPYMTGAAAALLPYKKARQTTATDILPLSAGSILGTCFGGSATAVYGVSYPVPDQYILIPSEIGEIKTRTTSFNNIIKNTVEASNGRVALADINAALVSLATNRAGVYNGVTITPNFAPPTGAFSEDGFHPNSRGYAFMANIFIDAINTKFSANVPKASLADYKGTGLPVSPL